MANGFATFGTQLPGNYVLLCQDTAALIVQAPWLGGWLQGVKEVGQKVRSYGDADEIHIICLLVMIHNYIIIMYLYIYIYIHIYIHIHIYIYIVWGIQPSFQFQLHWYPKCRSLVLGRLETMSTPSRDPGEPTYVLPVVGSIVWWELMLLNNQCYILLLTTLITIIVIIVIIIMFGGAW